MIENAGVSVDTRRPPRHLPRWVTRTIDVALPVIAALGLVDLRVYGPRASEAVALQGGLWITFGLAYVVIRGVRARRARRGDTTWPDRLTGRRLGNLITAVTVVMVLSTGFAIAATPLVSPEDDATTRGISVAMVLVGWAILHLSYAERYAREWLHAAEPPLDFPGTPAPSLLEFAYFSFTVGSTFGTSDVDIRSSLVRSMVLWHQLLSFVYNTVILALIIGLVAS